MANIAKRPTAAGGPGTGTPRHGALTPLHRKIDAQNWLDSVTTAVNTGTYIDRRGPHHCWRDRPTWLEGKINLRPTTERSYEAVLKKHVLRRWRGAAEQVAHGDIQALGRRTVGVGLAGPSARPTACSPARWPSATAGFRRTPRWVASSPQRTAPPVPDRRPGRTAGRDGRRWPPSRARARLLWAALVRAGRAARRPPRPTAPAAHHR